MADKEVGSLKRRIYKLFYKWLNVKPIAISSRVQKSFWDVYRLDDLEVPVIANGIDLGKCKRKVYIEDASSAVQVLHIGSFKKAKNHIGLIDSFRIVHEKNPNIVLNLIGAGHLEEMTRKRVEQLGLVEHVVFWGSKDDVFSYLEEADIFVLPSLWEGMPISLIEAMGTGVAIVATNVGGIPDMLENEVTALLVDVDEFEIADAILRLAENFELRERLGSNARSRSANFSAETMAMSYLKVYNESLEEKFSARRK
jgi:glycosyltransferase involved in cell wall biosynthesis